MLSRKPRGSLHAQIFRGSVRGSWPDLTRICGPRRLAEARGSCAGGSELFRKENKRKKTTAQVALLPQLSPKLLQLMQDLAWHHLESSCSGCRRKLRGNARLNLERSSDQAVRQAARRQGISSTVWNPVAHSCVASSERCLPLWLSCRLYCRSCKQMPLSPRRTCCRFRHSKIVECILNERDRQHG